MNVSTNRGPPPAYAATAQADALFRYQSRVREDRKSDAVTLGLTAVAFVTLPITMGVSCLLPGLYAGAAQKRRTPKFQQFSKHLFSTLGIFPRRWFTIL